MGLMTAADVGAYGHACDGGVEAVATAGLGVRGLGRFPAEGTVTAAPPGTINIVVALPVALTDAALVNAVATATEAKVQALLGAGYDCSRDPHGRRCASPPGLRAATTGCACLRGPPLAVGCARGPRGPRCRTRRRAAGQRLQDLLAAMFRTASTTRPGTQQDGEDRVRHF
ncbi:hypothetical protein SGLAM104S_07112 [Streptomyces glaucescens]